MWAVLHKLEHTQKNIFDLCCLTDDDASNANSIFQKF